MSKDKDLARAHLKIHGQVHGVGFRFFMNRKASALGLKGWVKNLGDGSVEAILEDKKEDIEECIKACEEGPNFAKVDKVEVSWEKPTGEFSHFEVK